MRTIGIEYPAPNRMHFCELGDPGELSPSQILIRTEFSGITNGTERHAMLGEFTWKHFPGRHGYQHVGIIEATGNEVEGFNTGERVFYGAYVGHRAWHIVDTENGPPLLITLPDDIDHPYCALFGVAGVGLRCVRRVRVRPAQKVWVVGQGLIGGFAAQAARAYGAHVTVTDIDENRLSLARSCGTHRVLDACDERVFEQLKEGGPYDIVIDGSGYKDLFFDIQEHALLARRGVIGALAVRGETTFDWSMLHQRELSVEVSCHFAVKDLTILRHFVREHIIHIKPVVSHRVSIDEAPDIYTILRDRPAELLGVIFDWYD